MGRSRRVGSRGRGVVGDWLFSGVGGWVERGKGVECVKRGVSHHGIHEQ